MDGTDRRIIVSTKIYWPNTIALDLTTDRVYFADSKLDYIDFVNYDGSGRTQVLSSSKFVQHPHALVIFEDNMYYSDRRLQRLQVYPKYPNGTTGDYPSHVFSKALGVAAIHPVLQPATAILKHCASGKHLTKVELSVCKAGGQQVEYTRITLEDVLVTSVQYTGADNGDTVGVTYAFQAAKVKQQYWEQTTAGGKGAESSAGWNIKENKEA